MSSGRPSICFVSPHNYATLSGRADLPHIGGAEIQQPMIAHELSRRGYQVSFVTLDHGQPDGIEHEGIRVHKMCSWSHGLPGLRFVYPRWTSLWRAMGRANADIYYQMNGGAETGQAAMWCARHRRVFVFAVASDGDCDPACPGLPRRRERVLYRYGLRRADVVVAQTRTQQQLLRQNWGIDSALIRSCTADPYDRPAGPSAAQRYAAKRILWVGRISPEKRLELFLELARAMPGFIHDVVGDGPADSAYRRSLLRRAEALPNVALHGRVPHDAMSRFYEKASILVCTSVYEGYPNTFMEAWAHGLPTVSTVDPDGVIAANVLGGVSERPSGLVQIIRKLLTFPDAARACSQRARRFFLDNHTVPKTVDAYEALFAHVACEHAAGAMRLA